MRIARTAATNGFITGEKVAVPEKNKRLEFLFGILRVHLDTATERSATLRVAGAIKGKGVWAYPPAAGHRPALRSSVKMRTAGMT